MDEVGGAYKRTGRTASGIVSHWVGFGVVRWAYPVVGLALPLRYGWNSFERRARCCAEAMACKISGKDERRTSTCHMQISIAPSTPISAPSRFPRQSEIEFSEKVWFEKPLRVICEVSV